MLCVLVLEKFDFSITIMKPIIKVKSTVVSSPDQDTVAASVVTGVDVEVPAAPPAAKKTIIKKATPLALDLTATTGAANDTDSNYSYLGHSIEDTYGNKDHWQHIYDDPDTYAGSKHPQEEEVWVITDEGHMVQQNISFRECLYKIFDEVLVNAIDQHHRLSQKINNGFPNLRPVKKIAVKLDPEAGVISVENDGEGMDVVVHKKLNMYVPQMIMGVLLTSANYDKSVKKTVGGKNGYGAKLANIFSQEFTIETVDSVRKLHYKQTWTNNMRNVGEPIITPYTKAPFTRLTYKPDWAYFEIQNPAVIADWKLFKKRAYDAAACTDSSVSIYLNDTKIVTKTFEDYINLYIGKKSECKRVYQAVNDRWEVAVCLSQDGEAQQVSFVNGICTDRGGRHVAHVLDTLSDKIMENLSEKDKKSLVIKPAFIKNNLFVFIRCTIENPSFDTQTKRKMTTLIKDFGSRCVLPDQFIQDVIKLGIIDRARKLAEFKAREDLGKKTDGRKHTRIYHPNLHDADEHARKHEFMKCTIVFTEGNGAAKFMSAGIEGLDMDQRKYWGWFPLRGKILNVQNASVKQLASNEEIKMMKQIMGLQEKVDYSIEANFKQLRYGRAVILADADDDGHHIRGLFMNFLGHYWPALLKRRGFLCDIATPIIKVTKQGSKSKTTAARARERDAPADYLEFFTIDQFNDWQQNNSLTGWQKPQYYKGLGTYESGEARALCSDMRVTEYVWNAEQIKVDGKEMESSDYNLLKLGFGKGYEECRRGWLSDGHVPKPDIPCKGKINSMTIDSFVHNRLKIFSLTDNHRSIPSLADSFKPAVRKIICTAFEEKLTTDTKVGLPQLMGAVIKNTKYHHGEASLESTITGMCDDYVGTNNIRLLFPAGGFGSRAGGGPKFKKGEDCAPARYIYTKWTSIAPLILNKMDIPLLTYSIEDGVAVEPEFYLPTYPLILNGDRGIGTGWSTFIPSHNPEEVIANTKAILDGQLPPFDLYPWYRGYNGRIVCLSPSKYLTIGVYHRVNANTIRITELPVGSKDCKSFKQYKEFLNTLLDEDVAKAHGVEVKRKPNKKKGAAAAPVAADSSDDSSDKSKSFKASVIQDYRVINESQSNLTVDIYFKEGVLEHELANNTDYTFEKKLKLAYMFSTTNMHACAPDGKVIKYNSVDELLRAFIAFRLPFYEKRRQYWMGKHKFDYERANAQYRFVNEIMDETLVIFKKTEEEIEQILMAKTPPYPKYAVRVEDNDDPTKQDYNYLLGMHIRSFSKETLARLAKEVEKFETLYKAMSETTAERLWHEDLDALLAEYKEYNEDWASRNKIKLQAPRKVLQIKAKEQVSTSVPKTLTKITATKVAAPTPAQTQTPVAAATTIKLKIKPKLTTLQALQKETVAQ